MGSPTGKSRIHPCRPIHSPTDRNSLSKGAGLIVNLFHKAAIQRRWPLSVYLRMNVLFAGTGIVAMSDMISIMNIMKTGICDEKRLSQDVLIRSGMRSDP